MCLVRLKQEGKSGKVAYKQLVTFMWEDVSERMRLLKVCQRFEEKGIWEERERRGSLYHEVFILD